jgi:hypothetical protein
MSPANGYAAAGSTPPPGCQVLRVISVLPPVERPGREPEVPADRLAFLAAGIMIHPAQPLGGILGDRPQANNEPDELRSRDD